MHGRNERAVPCLATVTTTAMRTQAEHRRADGAELVLVRALAVVLDATTEKGVDGKERGEGASSSLTDGWSIANGGVKSG